MNGVTKSFAKPKTEDYGRVHETVMKPSFSLCSASAVSCHFIVDAKKLWNMRTWLLYMVNFTNNLVDVSIFRTICNQDSFEANRRK